MKKEATVLIVEDSLISSEYLQAVLEDADYQVIDTIDTGAGAIKAAKRLRPDIILMDIMLKDNVSGSEAAVVIHQDLPDCKIIFLTAYADEEMITYAEQSHAYAYLVKPYREKEILATLQLALSNKTKAKTTSPDIIRLTNSFSFNKSTHRLYRDDHEVPLSKNSLRLIELLVKNRNSTVSDEQISQHVWGERRSSNTTRALLHRIRESVDRDLIHNVKGVGYMISSEKI